MEAMVFAAGKGTRLEPLTFELPKPAVPVAHVPLASYAISHLARFGIGDVRINLHHLGDALPPVLEPLLPAGLRVRYVHERSLFGTGGGLRHAFDGVRPRGPVVVMNGDILFAPDLGRAIEAHLETDAVATMVLRAHPDPARLGAVEIDEAGRVRRLIGHPERVEAPLRAFMFTGVHVLSPRAFDVLPHDGCIVRTAYRAWIERGETVVGVVDEAPFADLGTLESYLAANVAFAEGRPLVAPGYELPSVHPDAEIGVGANIEASVIGPRARVRAGVRLERCVVWPGASVDTDASDTIFTPAGRVPVRLSRCP